jgi:hypothetical protein
MRPDCPLLLLPLIFLYQHKQLQPQGAPNAGPPASSVSVASGQSRLNDCFDTIRQEFEALAQDANLIRNQKDEADAGRTFRFPCLSTFSYLSQFQPRSMN